MKGLYRSYIGDYRGTRLGLYRDYIGDILGIMENKMETTF